MTDKVRENRLRAKADRMGLILRKSKRRDPDAVDFGLYALIDQQHGGAIHPEGPVSPFWLTLDEVEEWLTEKPSEFNPFPKSAAERFREAWA